MNMVAASSQPTRDLLTVKDVSVMLDCHENTVYRLIWAGALKHVRVGRLVKVTRDAVGAYLRRDNRS